MTTISCLFPQALSFACAKWSEIPAADLSELPAELLLELLGSEVRIRGLAVHHT